MWGTYLFFFLSFSFFFQFLGFDSKYIRYFMVDKAIARSLAATCLVRDKRGR